MIGDTEDRTTAAIYALVARVTNVKVLETILYLLHAWIDRIQDSVPAHVVPRSCDTVMRSTRSSISRCVH